MLRVVEFQGEVFVLCFSIPETAAGAAASSSGKAPSSTESERVEVGLRLRGKNLGPTGFVSEGYHLQRGKKKNTFLIKIFDKIFDKIFSDFST